MVRRCGDNCEFYTRLEERNCIGDGICDYDTNSTTVQAGNKCIYDLMRLGESIRLPEARPFSEISPLAGLL